jgi:hypothetical protein
MKFKIVVEDGKKEVFSRDLNFYELQEYASSLEDVQSNNDIFKILAKHPSQDVRERIACKDNLNEEVCKIIEAEKSVYVLRSFVRTDGCKKYATQKYLINWISLDVEIASTIANYVENYENFEIEDAVKILMNHKDPAVLAELASNSSLNKKYLKQLANNIDSRVSKNALYSLR